MRKFLLALTLLSISVSPEAFAQQQQRSGTPEEQKACNRDVHYNSKTTTLPIARAIVDAYVRDSQKLPWYIDLLNINLDNSDLAEARRRIGLLIETFRRDGTRITQNLDFGTGEE